MARSLAMDSWTNESSDYETSKQDPSWFHDKPLSETSRDGSSDAQSPSKSSEGPVKISFFGSKSSPKGSLDKRSSSHPVKMLKFDDQPEVKTYEIEPRSSRIEPNRHTTYRHEGFWHAADQPLPSSSEIALDEDTSSMSKEPCSSSETAGYPS